MIAVTSSNDYLSGGKAEVFKAVLKGDNGGEEQEVAVKKLRYGDDTDKLKFSNVSKL